jgi:hypothetical protein
MRVETFETPGPLELVCRLGSADLRVETGEGPTTTVEIVGGRDDDATRELVDGFTVALRERLAGAELLVEEPKTRSWGFRLRFWESGVSVRIRCPEGTSLSATGASTEIEATGTLGRVEVKTGSGDVSLRGSAAGLRATTASGDVEAEVVGGPASISTASGDVEVGRVEGPLTVQAVSGDVEVHDARAGADVQSVSGDVEVAVVGGGDIRAQTVSGDVSLGIAPGVGVWIDASSVSGEVVSQLEVGDQPPSGGDDAPVYGLRVRTVSGDAVIARAARVG